MPGPKTKTSLPGSCSRYQPSNRFFNRLPIRKQIIICFLLGSWQILAAHKRILFLVFCLLLPISKKQCNNNLPLAVWHLYLLWQLTVLFSLGTNLNHLNDSVVFCWASAWHFLFADVCHFIWEPHSCCDCYLILFVLDRLPCDVFKLNRICLMRLLAKCKVRENEDMYDNKQPDGMPLKQLKRNPFLELLYVWWGWSSIID